MSLTHFDKTGNAIMVDVSAKNTTDRIAVAEGLVMMRSETLAFVTNGTAAKGDVLGVARVAGIMAAKRTPNLIPLCHPLPLSHVSVDFRPDETLPGVRMRATVRTTGNTGVEMEALTAVAIAGLTIHDMLKAVDKGITISDVCVVLKDGGMSGRHETASSFY